MNIGSRPASKAFLLLYALFQCIASGAQTSLPEKFCHDEKERLTCFRDAGFQFNFYKGRFLNFHTQHHDIYYDNTTDILSWSTAGDTFNFFIREGIPIIKYNDSAFSLGDHFITSAPEDSAGKIPTVLLLPNLQVNISYSSIDEIPLNTIDLVTGKYRLIVETWYDKETDKHSRSRLMIEEDNLPIYSLDFNFDEAYKLLDYIYAADTFGLTITLDGGKRNPMYARKVRLLDNSVYGVINILYVYDKRGRMDFDNMKVTHCACH